MKESNRQVVIFGDFKEIGFDVQNVLKDISEKYSLFSNSAPDYISNNGINGLVQINNFNLLQQLPFVSQTNMRPVLTSANNSFSVFFGTTRIHVEENNGEITDYDKFITMALEIISAVLTNYNNVYINRMAINGKMILEDEKKMEQIYSNAFKKSELYGEYSDEFAFRINTKFYNEEIESDINKIISFNRTSEILPQSEKKAILLIDYDYNTFVKEDSRFNISQLEILIKQGKIFKSKIV